MKSAWTWSLTDSILVVNGQGQRDLTSICFSGIRRLRGAVGEIHDIRDVLVSEFDDQRSSSVREVQKMYDYSPPDLWNQKNPDWSPLTSALEFVCLFLADHMC